MKPLSSWAVRILAILFVACASRPAPAADDKSAVLLDRWYSMLMQGQPAGWMHHLQTQEGDRITTRDEVNIAVRRGPFQLTVTVESRFVETAQGQPLEAVSRQALGAMRTTQTLRFGDDGIEVISEQAGREQRQKAPRIEGQWLTPAAAERYIAEQMKSGAKQIQYRTVEPMLGAVAHQVTLTIEGKENVEVLGKIVPAIVRSSTSSATPSVVAKEYVDEQGVLVKGTMTAMPGMDITVLAADEKLAKAQVNPPELLASTLIKPDRPIPRPRHLKSAEYELRIAAAGDSSGATAKVDLPQGGPQRIAWEEQSGQPVARVTVNVGQADDVDPPADAYRKPTPALDSDDPEVRKLVDKALAGQPNDLSAAKKAELLRQFVAGYIQAKDLSVGMATASEVARTAQGDCTEHAVLLAAMLRAAGIPSRTVSGVAYVDRFMGSAGVFGYHMWTQAWIPSSGGKGHWTDLDAALADEPFDATHIALSTSPMAGAAIANDLLDLLPVLGRVSLKVVKTGTSAGE